MVGLPDSSKFNPKNPIFPIKVTLRVFGRGIKPEVTASPALAISS
jgi:hypothetical protein